MTEREFSVRKILVAVDATGDVGRILEAAGELAHGFRCEIVGLFVEDENLLRCAALPFVKRAGVIGGASQEFDPARIEEELRCLAAQARRILEAAAARHQLRWSFQVVRGDLGAAVEAAAAEVDLLVLEGERRPLTRHVGLASPTRGAISRVTRSVFVHRVGLPSRRSAAVVVEDSPDADRVLSAAARLAAADALPLNILLIASEGGEAVARIETSVRAVSERGLPVRWERLETASSERVCAWATEVGARFLVIQGSSPILADLLDRIACPVLVVRESPPEPSRS